MAAVLNAGGPPDLEKTKAVMIRHGLVPAVSPNGGVSCRPIPTGLCPLAQGCRVCEATLGYDSEMKSTATRLWQMSRVMNGREGRNRVAVVGIFLTRPQGSSFLAT